MYRVKMVGRGTEPPLLTLEVIGKRSYPPQKYNTLSHVFHQEYTFLVFCAHPYLQGTE